MSDRAAPPRPVLLGAEPQLFVDDVAASCRFFEERLGFATVFMHGDPPFYAQVERDAARLNLRHVDRLPLDPAFRAGEADALSASIPTEGIGDLFGELERAGAPFHQRLRTEPWGARTFIVADPDGNLVLFSGR